jgi:hypothetical protein
MKVSGLTPRGQLRLAVGFGLAVTAVWPWWPGFAADSAGSSRSAGSAPLNVPITALLTPPESPATDASGGAATPQPGKPSPDTATPAGPGTGRDRRLGDDAVINISPDRGGSTTGDDGPRRDPTQPGPNMRQLLAPRSKALNIPAIQLKARIVTAGQVPVVILGIDKNLYIAKLGDEFSPAGDSSGLTFRVSTVSDREVRLEVTPLGRSVILY